MTWQASMEPALVGQGSPLIRFATSERQLLIMLPPDIMQLKWSHEICSISSIQF